MGNSLFKRYQHIKCPWFSGVSHLPSNDYYLFSLFSMQFGFYLHRLHFCSPNVPKFDEKHKVKSLHSQSLHPHILEEVETCVCWDLLGNLDDRTLQIVCFVVTSTCVWINQSSLRSLFAICSCSRLAIEKITTCLWNCLWIKSGGICLTTKNSTALLLLTIQGDNKQIQNNQWAETSIIPCIPPATRWSCLLCG